MGHLREVGDDGAALDVLADDDLQRALVRIFDDVAQEHALARAVGHLDPDVVRAGDGREDAHARCRQRKRDVLLERRDAADAHACGQIDFEQRHRRSGDPANDFGHDSEAFERLLETGRGVGQLGVGSAVLLGVLRHGQQVRGR